VSETSSSRHAAGNPRRDHRLGRGPGLLIERAASRALVGDVYMAAYRACFPAAIAFVDSGLDRAAFLHVAGHLGAAKGDEEPAKPIERILTEGQSIMVQVIKDPIGTKGARLPRRSPSPAGCRIPAAGSAHRQLAAHRDEGGPNAAPRREKDSSRRREGGLIIAHACRRAATDESLRADLDYLRHLAGDPRALGAGAAAAMRLYQDLRSRSGLLPTWSNAGTGRVWSIRARTTSGCGVRRTATCRSCGQARALQRASADLRYVQRRPEIEKALSGRVELKSGRPSHHQTEAAHHHRRQHRRFVGSRNFDDTSSRPSLEAAQSIARSCGPAQPGGISSPISSTQHPTSIAPRCSRSSSARAQRATAPA